MNTLIKAVEVWVPGNSGLELEFGSGSYTQLKIQPKLRAEQAAKVFAIGEGLVGLAWSSRAPVVANTNENNHLIPSELNIQCHVEAAIAVPIFAGAFLTSVVVFYCTNDSAAVGAIEHWQCATADSYDLKLKAGYFGHLEHFEFISKHTSFRKGIGMPGKVWELGKSILIEDVSKSRIFVRSQGAAEAKVNSAFAFPCFCQGENVDVLAFLSAQGSPVAQQVELWSLGAESGQLEFDNGMSSLGLPLQNFYEGKRVTIGEGMLGRVLVTGRPELSEDANDFYFSETSSDRDLTLSCKLVIPIINGGSCSGAVVMYF